MARVRWVELDSKLVVQASRFSVCVSDISPHASSQESQFLNRKSQVCPGLMNS